MTFSPRTARSTPTPAGAYLHLGSQVRLLQASQLRLEDDDLLKHLLIAGSPDSGAEHMSTSLLQQQTIRGGGWVVMVDARNSLLVEGLESAVRAAGRAKQLQVLDFSNPGDSTYSSLHHGTPADVAERILALLPEVPDSPGSGFYSATAIHALTAVLGALQDAGRPVTFPDLSQLLASADQLQELAVKIQERNRDHELLNLVGDFRTRSEGLVRVDREKVAQVLRGIAAQIGQLGQGKVGQVLNTAQPTVDLADVLSDRRMLLIKFMPTGPGALAIPLRRMITAHLQSAMQAVLEKGSVRSSAVPFIIASDDAAAAPALLSDKMVMLTRATRISCMLRVDSLSELFDCSKAGGANPALENTAVKMFFGATAIGTHVQAMDWTGRFLARKVANLKRDEFQYVQGLSNIHCELPAAWRP